VLVRQCRCRGDDAGVGDGTWGGLALTMSTCCAPGAPPARSGMGVLAPSRIGTFLRSFTFAHVRQLDRLLGEVLGRAWTAGAGPGDGRLVVDVDSVLGEVFGVKKHGAAFGYTRVRGYHPILATRADTGEVI